MRWLVPADYPHSSPMLLDTLPGGWRLEIIESIQVVYDFCLVNNELPKTYSRYNNALFSSLFSKM